MFLRQKGIWSFSCLSNLKVKHRKWSHQRCKVFVRISSKGRKRETTKWRRERGVWGCVCVCECVWGRVPARVSEKSVRVCSFLNGWGMKCGGEFTKSWWVWEKLRVWESCWRRKCVCVCVCVCAQVSLSAREGVWVRMCHMEKKEKVNARTRLLYRVSTKRCKKQQKIGRIRQFENSPYLPTPSRFCTHTHTHTHSLIYFQSCVLVDSRNRWSDGEVEVEVNVEGGFSEWMCARVCVCVCVRVCVCARACTRAREKSRLVFSSPVAADAAAVEAADADADAAVAMLSHSFYVKFLSLLSSLFFLSLCSA